MKRWCTHSFIVAYLGALCLGIACHALNVGLAAHPGIYYIVWDMFCGWSAHSSRLHMVAEGESGKYYQLTPPPWGEINPYGGLARSHYDYPVRHLPKMAECILNHSHHEEMTRIFIVEESWPKKYNLPDSVWNQLFDQPKDVKPYFHVRKVMTPDGLVLESNATWVHRQFAACISKNPRLQVDMHRSKPFYAISPSEGSRSQYRYGGTEDPATRLPTGSTLGE